MRNSKLRARIGQLLGDRFREVIVDEAQDCGPEEIEVLRLLREFGCDVVAVADLDQAIFEFRRATPEAVGAFLSELPSGRRLDGNFRSTPAICEVNRRLRVSDDVDEACGDRAGLATPVRLLSFDDEADVRAAVEAILNEEGLPVGGAKVIAHKRKDAKACAGAVNEAPVGNRKVLRVAQANLVIRHDTDPTRRRRAIESIERVLLELTDAPRPEDRSTHALAEAVGVQFRWLRDAAVRVCLGANPEGNRTDYAASIRGVVESLDWPDGVKTPNLGGQLAAPTEGEWTALTAAQGLTGLPWDSIHAVKGRAIESVVLVVPKSLPTDENDRTCLDLWEQGLDGESRRVLYVGASRAERLLVLAVHQAHAERVEALVFG